MRRIAVKIINFGIIVLLLFGLFLWSKPAAAGVSTWSAETIPSTTGYMLGPSGTGNNTDIRDWAIGNDNKTIYVAPGDSITSNITFKSVDGGVTWAALATPIRTDKVAVSPDDNNTVVIANNSTDIYLSPDGGGTWNTLNFPGAIPTPAGINDIAISTGTSGIHYIAAAGWEASDSADLWYFPYGATSPAWQNTNGFPGFTSNNETTALAFSPDFASDGTLVTVTSNATTGAYLQIFNVLSSLWNESASYTGYPLNITSGADMTNMTRLLSASISLAPTYDGMDVNNHNLFIGMTIGGDSNAAAASGIYRFQDTVETSILSGKLIRSVAYNGSYLIAGPYDSTTVYSILSPMAVSSWTVRTSTPTKNPGGDNQTLVAWLGSSVAAGTSGSESAFSISQDTGMTFNDISLIDTKITNASDVAVCIDASKVYLVTDDGADTSVWYEYSNTWTRVLSLKGVTNCIVRVEEQSANVVYVTQKGSALIYYNGASGAAQWQTRTSPIPVQDIAVESSSVLYVLDNTGRVVNSNNNGLSWQTVVSTTLTSGNMLYSIGTNELLAGSQDGYVAYTLNGMSSWTKIPQAFSSGATNMQMQAVPDQNFATNQVIYAATQSPGEDIKSWQIGTSNAWTDIFPVGVPGGIYGMAVDSNTLYALEYDTTTSQSTLWRFTNPISATATAAGWTGISTNATTDTYNYSVALNAEPEALKVSTNKLWAVKTNGTNELYSFTDTIINVSIALNTPQNNFVSHINSKSGLAYDVTFSWQRPSVATQYELQMATDPDFTQMASSIIINSTADVVSITLGHDQAVPNYFDFSPSSTYYWRVRSTSPGYSQFSTTWEFSIESAPFSFKTAIQILSPAIGSTIIERTPSFSWQRLQNTTEYEFKLSENLDMSTPLLDAIVATPGIKMIKELETDKTYFWQVRGTSPIESDWSPLGVFTVESVVTTTAPVITPPTTVFKTTVIQLPKPTQTQVIFAPPTTSTPKKTVPGYLIFSIFILAAIVVAVLYLIITPAGRRYGTRGGIHVRQSKENVQRANKPTRPSAPEPGSGTNGTTAEKILGKSKDSATVIFAAKSLMWMSTAEKGTAEAITEKEKTALGKKLASRILELSKKEPLYIRHAEDAAMLLHIWAQYGSRKETNRYLTESFKSRPENAVRLLKCYLPPGISPEASNADTEFTMESYEAIAEVVDADKVYEALTKESKFKPETSKEPIRVNPADRNIAAKFMRLHLQVKNNA